MLYPAEFLLLSICICEEELLGFQIYYETRIHIVNIVHDQCDSSINKLKILEI